MTASTELRGPEDIVVAAINLTAKWAGYAACDNAKHMTRNEMESMAELFICCGEPLAARDLIECWIEAEIADDEAEHGDYNVVDLDGLNGPRLIDNREET